MRVKLTVNLEKINTMAVGQEWVSHQVKVERHGELIQIVFKYLGGCFSGDGGRQEDVFFFNLR